MVNSLDTVYLHRMQIGSLVAKCYLHKLCPRITSICILCKQDAFVYSTAVSLYSQYIMDRMLTKYDWNFFNVLF